MYKRQGLVFEDFKFEILETKDENYEEESKEKELVEPINIKSKELTEGAAKSKPEGDAPKTKRRYSKRKSSSRRGQSRVKGRRPYTSGKKSDLETISVKEQESTKSLEFEENSLHAVPEKVDPPIIPLPAPFVRSESTTISETQTEGDKPSSIPDGKLS